MTAAFRCNLPDGESSLTVRLLILAAIIELFLLSLWVVAPVAAISQTISPLALRWPWLLGPARLIFGTAQVDGSIPPERGWPALLLLATLLVGVSCHAALVIPICRRFPNSSRRYLVLALGCCRRLWPDAGAVAVTALRRHI